MYLFRALNNKDEQNITTKSRIIASRESSSQILSELGATYGFPWGSCKRKEPCPSILVEMGED